MVSRDRANVVDDVSDDHVLQPAQAPADSGADAVPIFDPARLDALTGELNREGLTEILEAAIEEAVKLRSSCGFLLASIDDLGRINEAYGFDIADEVIAAVAKRLHSQMRGKDSLGRVAGNKFGIVLNNCTPDDLSIAADRLVAGIRNDVMQTSAGPVAATVTIGGLTAPRHARNVSEVLARAQDALYGARARRHGSFQAYQPNLKRAAERQENMRATDEILSALNERRIFILFEPVVDIASRRPAFYECLMRIKRPDGSLLAVNEFIPWAERLGLVRLLDHRVLDLVAAEMTASPALNVSVNVSAASTGDPDWWAALAAMLRARPGVAERLTVEITETAAIQDIDETRGFVARVKALGCRIAIDDFGAGYTSFRNLRRLGVDLVKIDGAFVRNLMQSEDDRAFVHTLIDLGRRLGLKTVAEWVQDEASAAMLADWGCDYLQGVLVGLASAERPWDVADRGQVRG
jgi:diguanylate cyclase (GGDEF)-like protein